MRKLYKIKTLCENYKKFSSPYSTLSRVSPFDGIVLPTASRSRSEKERAISSSDKKPWAKQSIVPAIVLTILYKNPAPQT